MIIKLDLTRVNRDMSVISTLSADNVWLIRIISNKLRYTRIPYPVLIVYPGLCDIHVYSSVFLIVAAICMYVPACVCVYVCISVCLSVCSFVLWLLLDRLKFVWVSFSCWNIIGRVSFIGKCAFRYVWNALINISTCLLWQSLLSTYCRIIALAKGRMDGRLERLRPPKWCNFGWNFGFFFLSILLFACFILAELHKMKVVHSIRFLQTSCWLYNFNLSDKMKLSLNARFWQN